MSDPIQEFLDHGLLRLTMGEMFAERRKLFNAVKKKCAKVQTITEAERRLVGRVGIINEMVLESIMHNYPGPSVMTFASFLSALHYFLKLKDKHPDNTKDGYRDDFRVVKHVTDRHRREIKKYLEWKLKNRNTAAN